MKILILKNGIKNLFALERGIMKAQELCAGIGLTLDITYQDIDKTFDSIPISSDVVSKGFSVDPQEILNATLERPDLICLISSWDKILPGNWSSANPINPCSFDLDITTLSNTIVTQITEEWYNDYDWVLTQFFLHELCHFLYDKTDKFPDLTHSRYSNALYVQKDPNEYYLYLLASLVPYIAVSAPTEPVKEVYLKRMADNGVETVGVLYTVNGNKAFAARTLELTYKNNQRDISSIPKGTYTVLWTSSPRLGKYTYEVQNVLGRSGIRIHSFNYFSEVKGCIGLGSGLSDLNNDGQLDIVNSTKTISDFENFMGRKPFKLKIS